MTLQQITDFQFSLARYDFEKLTYSFIGKKFIFVYKFNYNRKKIFTILKNTFFLLFSSKTFFNHYDKVIDRIKDCKKTLWIGTADIKDLYVKDGRGTKPLLEVLSDLAKRGVEIRLIHAKEPGPAFRQDFDKYPALIEGLERVLCPRVHFKIIVFDLKTAYVGSANLTGAGLGMKGENTRNFEAGVLSSNKDFVKNAAEQFDSVWMGAHCTGCRRKAFCGDPIV